MKNNPTQKDKYQILHSFGFYPSLRFETQEKDEDPILLLRMHPITQVYWVINGLFFLIILFFLNLIISSYFSMGQIIFFNIFFGSLILSYFWFNFLNWYFNVGIITNKKIVDVDYHGVIYKEVTMTKINNVEDITSKTGGYFSSIFDYGNVFIQTAGTEANIEYVNIPHPSQVVSLINNLVGKNHGY